jgi:hypothetical protein
MLKRMERDLFSHNEFASTFDERLDENKYFDSINSYRKHHQHNFSSQIHTFPKQELNKFSELKKNKNHVIFPNRQVKSFDQLDQEYFLQSQIPERRFENRAETRYKQMYSMFSLPYNTINNQNEDYVNEKNIKVQFYTSDKPAGPQNENWVVDDSQERIKIGAPKVDDSYRFQIDSSLIDWTKNKTKIVFKNYA